MANFERPAIMNRKPPQVSETDKLRSPGDEEQKLFAARVVRVNPNHPAPPSSAASRIQDSVTKLSAYRSEPHARL